MIRIPAVDGTYELECDSNCTHREISSGAQTVPLYSYVAANTAKAHVKVG